MIDAADGGKGLWRMLERCESVAALGGVRIDAALVTSRCPGRISNEDRFVLVGPGNPTAEAKGAGYLFGVLDGCGGAPGGADAAQLAADEFSMVIARLEVGVEPARIEVLTTAAREVNHVIVRGRRQSSDLSRMATTATLVWLWSDSPRGPLRAAIVHVGDSRAILVRAGRARQLTTDYEDRGVLTRYLGMSEAEFACDVAETELAAGDVLLLATDGLFKPRAVNVADLLVRAEGDAGDIATVWLDAARRAGSQDDATAIVIRLLPLGRGR